MALITDSIEIVNTAGGANAVREFFTRIKGWMLDADLGYEVEEDVYDVSSNVIAFVLKHTATNHYVSFAVTVSADTFIIQGSGSPEIRTSGQIGFFTDCDWYSNVVFKESNYHFKCNVVLAKHDSNNFIIGFLPYSSKAYIYQYGIMQTTNIEGDVVNTYIITPYSSTASSAVLSKCINQKTTEMKTSYEALGTNKSLADSTKCVIQPAILKTGSIIDSVEIPQYLFNIILPANISAWTLVEISNKKYLTLNYPNFAYKVD